MRKVNPTPELFSPGKWKKADDKKARVALESHEYWAPLDQSDCSTDIRKHEYFHIKYSEPRSKAPKEFLDGPYSGILSNIVNAFEDHRVNYLAERNDEILVTHAADNIIGDLLKSADKWPPMSAAEAYVSSRAYNLPVELDDLMRSRFPDKILAVNALLAELDENPTTENMYQVSEKFRQLFYKDADKTQEENKEKEKRNDQKLKEYAEKNAKRRQKAHDEGKPFRSSPKPKLEELEEIPNVPNMPGAEMSIIDMAKEQAKTNELQGGGLQPGTMVIKHDISKMRQADHYKGVRLRPRRKPSAYGATFKYTHRLLTDKACFSTPMKDNLGTVLIDVSGSMTFTKEDLEAMLQFSGRATIAIYAGLQVTGELIVLAKGGRCVPKIPYSKVIRHNNVIDVPAMEWLINQPSPRWWVCDGHVTGLHNRTGKSISVPVYNMATKGRVKQVESVEEFMEMIKKNTLKQYKRKLFVLGMENGQWDGTYD
jgi:hypothetical protein